MFFDTRGSIVENKRLSQITWLRVGGPADYFFMPADTRDLIKFLRKLPEDINIFPIGLGSNLIVRDGGIRGVVIRLGSSFNNICLLYTSPSPRDRTRSRMPSSA